MRCRLLAVVVALSLSPLWLSSAASAVGIDWVSVGGPANLCDSQAQGCFGTVVQAYQISKYEVTNAQYAEFLNAKAASDPLGLYDTAMGSGYGGITQIGSSGSHSYSTIPGRENLPVNFVSFYDALRFANWLGNGQGSGDTDSGSYTLLGGRPRPRTARSSGATSGPAFSCRPRTSGTRRPTTMRSPRATSTTRPGRTRRRAAPRRPERPTAPTVIGRSAGASAT